MLHVCNGDVTAEILRAAEVPGEVLPWRDVLHDGPVPTGLDDERLAALRGEFIARRGWATSPLEVARAFWQRDRQLEDALRRGTPLALWFEDDLHDLLQLLQVLERVGRASGTGPLRVRLVWLPQEPPLEKAVHPMLATAEAITQEHLHVASRAWAAFRAPDPGMLLDGDWAGLDNLPEAVERHFEQFPATDDGLDRTERALLDGISMGAHTPQLAFAYSQAREERPFLGDSTAFWYLARMAASPTPLIELGSKGLRLTRAGGAALSGELDWPGTQRGEWDRWRGGVRLRGPDPAWRYDGATRTLVGVSGSRAPASAP